MLLALKSSLSYVSATLYPLTCPSISPSLTLPNLFDAQHLLLFSMLLCLWLHKNSSHLTVLNHILNEKEKTP
jgi:hypothetical protein